MNIYDASTPVTAAAGRADPLDRMRRQQVDRDLADVVDRIDDLAARMAEQEAAEGMDPQIVELLEEITGADDAPLTFRSLRGRVRQGVLTWADYWAQPQEQAEGMVLFHAVLQAQLARAAELSAQRPEQ